MRQFLFIIFLSSLCLYTAEVQAQTNADISGPENVLVVYKIPDPNIPGDTISREIKDYYQTERSIPSSNIKGLNIPASAYNGAVQLEQEGEVIRRMGSCSERYYEKRISNLP